MTSCKHFKKFLNIMILKVGFSQMRKQAPTICYKVLSQEEAEHFISHEIKLLWLKQAWRWGNSSRGATEGPMPQTWLSLKILQCTILFLLLVLMPLLEQAGLLLKHEYTTALCIIFKIFTIIDFIKTFLINSKAKTIGTGTQYYLNYQNNKSLALKFKTQRMWE